MKNRTKVVLRGAQLVLIIAAMMVAMGNWEIPYFARITEMEAAWWWRLLLALVVMTIAGIHLLTKYADQFWDAGQQLALHYKLPMTILLLGAAAATSLPELGLTVVMSRAGAYGDIVGAMTSSDWFNVGVNACIGLILLSKGSSINGKRFVKVMLALCAMNAVILIGTHYGFGQPPIYVPVLG